MLRPSLRLPGKNAFQAASLVCAGLALGSWGIRWGLPSRERIAAVLPPGFLRPAFFQHLTETWVERHRTMGPNLMLNLELSTWHFTGVQRAPAGWKEPPPILTDSFRSFFVRSAYDDEQTFLLILSRMRPRQLDFHPHFFLYGAAHIYALGAWLAAAAATGLVELHRSLVPYMEDPAKMAALYLCCRLLSVAAYIGCGLVLLRIGGQLQDRWAGWLAGMLFLASPPAVVQTHLVKNSTFWTFFSLLALERSAAILLGGRTRDYLLAGAAAGMAMGTSVAGLPVCMLVAAAAVLRVRDGAKAPAEAKGLLLAAAACVAVFFAANPYWILDWAEVSAEFAVNLKVNRGIHFLQPVRFLTDGLRHAVTAPVAALVAAGAVLAGREWRRDKVRFLCLCCFCIGVASTAANPRTLLMEGNMRFYLVWMALGLILAARAITARGRWRAARLALGFLAALTLSLEGIAQAHNFHLAATTRSNHYLAGRWIEENIPAGSPIGALRLPAPSNIPYFRFDRYEIVLIEPTLFGGLPQKDLPRFMLVTTPDYDDRPGMEPNLSRYERVALFDRLSLLPWMRIRPASTAANPAIEVYRLK